MSGRVTFEVDTSKIMAKLRVGRNFLKSPRSTRIRWRAELFNEYKQMVESAMGSIEAIGGHVRMSFQGESGQVYWKNLAPLTLRKKALYRYGKLTKMGALNPYAEYKWDFTIWVTTGRTKAEGVKISRDFEFVGIGQESDPKLLKRALRTETGNPPGKLGKVPPRPLFAVANDLAIRAIHKGLSNPGSPLAKALREEIVSKLRGIMDWGDKTGRENFFLLEKEDYDWLPNAVRHAAKLNYNIDEQKAREQISDPNWMPED